MKTVTTHDVRQLLEHREQPCVSVYMTTDAARPGGPADRTRLVNLLRHAAQKLEQRHPRREVERLLLPVVEHVHEAWPPRGRGIALLRSPGMNVGFHLPVAVPDVAVVASTFHTKPLLSYIDRNRHYFVLTLSERSVRLLEGTVERLVDVTAEVIPERLRAPARRDGAAGEGRAPERRDQQEAEQARKGRLRQRFLELEEAVIPHVRQTSAPLVLAGVRSHQATFRTLSGYAWILARGLDGNVDRLSEHDLHAQVWPLVRAEQAELEGEAAAHYHAFRAVGKATDVLAEVILAAGSGRVRLLLHREGTHLWGRMDPDTGAFVLRPGQAETLPGDSDLIDDLCELTLVRGGHVLEVAPPRMPTDVAVAALLRY
jgi:hypothetical protein